MAVPMKRFLLSLALIVATAVAQLPTAISATLPTGEIHWYEEVETFYCGPAIIAGVYYGQIIWTTAKRTTDDQQEPVHGSWLLTMPPYWDWYVYFE